MPEDWNGFADLCDDVLSGGVTLSSKARPEVKSASFDEPQTATRCLHGLANEYRNFRLNGSTGDLRKLLESGIQNDYTGGDNLEFKWNDRDVAVESHIKNGANTHEPTVAIKAAVPPPRTGRTVSVERDKSGVVRQPLFRPGQRIQNGQKCADVCEVI